ncbi:MAG TPA: hypothetical protein VMY87_09025 [Armatimonadota bacterium]|nr:hypothetical protein [Armatimonadota bacterium]
MAARKPSSSNLVAVTNQYPKDVLEALSELVAVTHSPKAHHLREALRSHLETHGQLSRPLWEFCGEQVPVIISSLDERQTASLPEMYALIQLGDRLAPSRLDVYLASDPAWKRGTDMRDSFIVLGGPRQNRVGAELLGQWDKVIPFELTETEASGGAGYTLRNRETGETWVPDSAPGERVANDFSDFGLVVKAPSPRGSGTCLLLAGCHAFGTHAAVRALTDPRSVAVITRLLPSTDAYFAAVVQVRVRNFWPEPPVVAELEVIGG